MHSVYSAPTCPDARFESAIDSFIRACLKEVKSKVCMRCNFSLQEAGSPLDVHEDGNRIGTLLFYVRWLSPAIVVKLQLQTNTLTK